MYPPSHVVFLLRPSVEFKCEEALPEEETYGLGLVVPPCILVGGLSH